MNGDFHLHNVLFWLYQGVGIISVVYTFFSDNKGTRNLQVQHWACSQRNGSRSESCFRSWSASWLGSWFELHAFTSIANAVLITNRICALRGNILFLLRSPRWLTHMHGFSAHFKYAHVQITFGKSFAFTCPQNQAFCVDHDPKLFRVSKAWALHSQRVKSGFQIRKGSESRSETAFRTWFVPLWTGPLFDIKTKGLLVKQSKMVP